MCIYLFADLILINIQLNLPSVLFFIDQMTRYLPNFRINLEPFNMFFLILEDPLE